MELLFTALADRVSVFKIVSIISLLLPIPWLGLQLFLPRLCGKQTTLQVCTESLPPYVFSNCIVGGKKSLFPCQTFLATLFL